MLLLELAWPSKQLAAGARGPGAHSEYAWNAAIREARAALQALAPTLSAPPGATVTLDVVFIRPHGRRVALADLKERFAPALAGLAYALHSSQERWAVTYRVSKVPTPGGHVLVRLTVDPAPVLPGPSDL